MDNELDVQEEAPIQRITGGVHGLDLNRRASETVEDVWTPDPDYSDEKASLLVYTRALTGEDLGSINHEFQKLRQVPKLIEFEQDRFQNYKPSRQIARKRKLLDEVTDTDFSDDPDSHAENFRSAEDKAEDRCVQLETEIKALVDEWEQGLKTISARIDELSSGITAYELLRSRFFSRVVASHDISWKGELLDFSQPAAPGKEPTDEFAGLFYTYLTELISNEKKAKRRSGGSVR